MKNIHVLPTSQPSRLVTFFTNKFHLCKEILPIQDEEQYQNIYITSNEEIKEGDWFHYRHFGEDIISKADKNTDLVNINNSDRFYQKIILTTDQDLIQDGVQSIDDEFLEWFVKNPSCEFVETERLEDGQYFDYLEDNSVIEGIYENYKIIIPKEEPNPLTVGKEFYESADKNITVYRQETLEEVAEKWVFETNGHKWSNNDDTAGDNFASFIAGAKLQAERMYSEEDLLSAFEAGMMFIGEDKGSFREWFEKFKKK
jgi:hypothetical protein